MSVTASSAKSSRPTPKTPASKAKRSGARKSPSRGDRYWLAISSTVKKLPASEVDIRRAAIAALESERADSALLSIAFIGSRAMTSLNAKYLRKRRPTDVIAFAFQNPAGGSAIVGDIYICPDVARANARRQRVPLKQEILRLVVHGTLHTLGHDHPESDNRVNSAMWRRQEDILASLR